MLVPMETTIVHDNLACLIYFLRIILFRNVGLFYRKPLRKSGKYFDIFQDGGQFSRDVVLVLCLFYHFAVANSFQIIVFGCGNAWAANSGKIDRRYSRFATCLFCQILHLKIGLLRLSST